MARLFYGGSGADVIARRVSELDDTLLLTLDVTYDVYTARTGGSLVTDLQDAAGGAITEVTPDENGVRFKGPSGSTAGLWLQNQADPTEPRWLVTASQDLAPTVEALQEMLLPKNDLSAIGIYLPEAYGAVGGEVTDDTTAVQAAVTASLGGAAGANPSPRRTAIGRVYLSKFYRVTAPIVVKSSFGFHLEGSNVIAAGLVADGITGNVLDLNGSKDGYYEHFSIRAVGAYSASFTSRALIALNWDNTTAASSSTNNKFNDIRLYDAKFLYGFDIGGTSSNLDVSQTKLSHIFVSGDRSNLSDAGTTVHQRAFSIGSGVAGNILNVWGEDVTFQYCRYGVYVDAVNNVCIRDTSSAYCNYSFYKKGTGTLTIDTGRHEESRHLLGSLGGSSTASSAKISNTYWSPNTQAGIDDNHVIEWNYGGSLIIENFHNQYDGVQEIFVSSAAGTQRRINVTINGFTHTRASSTLMVVSGTTKAVVDIRSYLQIDGSGAIVAHEGPVVKTYNLNDFPDLELTQFVEFDEMGADPAAPGANKGRLFVKDNGGGKSQIVARFPSGAVQVIATEP